MPGKLNEMKQKFVLAKMLYPAITIVFIAVVILLFGKTAMFLTDKINKVFTASSVSLQQQVPGLDLVNYELIEDRFGWPEDSSTTPDKISPSIMPEYHAATTTATTTAKIISSDTPAVAAEKSGLIIEIFNGPQKGENGIPLQADLVNAGFTGVKLDSHQLILKNTIVQFKNSNMHLQKYLSQITGIINGKFAAQVGSALPDNSVYDVSILIGQK
jgi:hypothetical protein